MERFQYLIGLRIRRFLPLIRWTMNLPPLTSTSSPSTNTGCGLPVSRVDREGPSAFVPLRNTYPNTDESIRGQGEAKELTS